MGKSGSSIVKVSVVNILGRQPIRNGNHNVKDRQRVCFLLLYVFSHFIICCCIYSLPHEILLPGHSIQCQEHVLIEMVASGFCLLYYFLDKALYWHTGSFGLWYFALWASLGFLKSQVHLALKSFCFVGVIGICLCYTNCLKIVDYIYTHFPLSFSYSHGFHNWITCCSLTSLWSIGFDTNPFLIKYVNE